MPLSSDQRARYARHLLLAEIGDAEQEAWCEARVTFGRGIDPSVLATARDYLQRAGVAEVAMDDALPAAQAGPTPEDVRRVAGGARLEHAAAALLGAFEAVEALKREAGVGTPGTFPPDLTLSEVKP